MADTSVLNYGLAPRKASPGFAVGFPAQVPSLGNLESYIAAVNRMPMLSADEEQALARAWQEREDRDAAGKLVMSHLRVVVSVARHYLGYGLPHADLIQEGNVGLMKAVRRFDPAQGVRLVSYALHWIKAEIHEYILRNWRMVKVATTKAQRKLFFNLRKSKKRLGWLNAEEVRAVAKDLGVPEATVLEMEARMSNYDVAFDAPADADDDAPPAPALYLEDHGADPYRTVAEADQEDRDLDSLQHALTRLDARAQDIIRRRWLDADSKITLQELADKYGVSAERIRQIESAALKKMRASFEA